LCFSKCIVCGPAPVSAVIPDLIRDPLHAAGR
jgi:hypothetical protein